MLLSIEGMDNTGKSSLSRLLGEDFVARGIRTSVVSDPPSISPWIEFKKTLLSDPEMSNISKAMVFLSARLDSYSRLIMPALSKDEIVIVDRFIDSWFAYQMVTLSDLFGGCDKAYSFLAEINFCCMKSGLISQPDKTFLLTANPSDTVMRGEEKGPSIYDSLAVQTKVQENLLWLSEGPGRNRIVKVDTAKRSLQQVHETLLDLSLQAIGSRIR